MTLAIGDFAYRAEMADGTVEHELCPVVVAEIDSIPLPDPDEVDAVQWIDWRHLVARARTAPESLSPWSVAQIDRLAAELPHPSDLFRRDDRIDAILDRVPGRPRARTAARIDTIDPTRRRIDQHLAAFLGDRLHDVPEAGDATGALHGAIERLAAGGGKRLRPAFVLWGHVAAGGEMAHPAALDAAAAVELLHTFALLHDDVMDRSATRRGRPTAQHTLRDRSTGGDAEWFGISAAVLAGDLAFVWADQLFDAVAAHAVEGAHVARGRELFTTLRTEVIAGQYLDLRTGCSPAATESDALRIARLKSARYTVTRPLQIGAALAGADDSLQARLADYGDATGVAFQLRDDVLGVFGDPRQTGKSRVDDLREGKRTLLVLRALALTTAAGRAELEAALGRADLDEAAAERCRDVIASSGALATIEATIELHLARAVAAASHLEPIVADVLTQMAEQSALREC
jgi:geranylgeranyl diphosphate synthase type I